MSTYGAQKTASNTSSAPTFILQTVDYIAVAALAVQTWEWIANLTEEIEYLWRKRFNSFHALYIGSRYLLLIGQIINQFMFHQSEDRSAQFPPVCEITSVFQSVLCQISLKLVEVILLIRVYDLYNRRFKAKYFLLAVFAFSSALELAGNAIFILTNSHFSGCGPWNANGKGVIIFAIGATVCQLVVFITTIVNFFAIRRFRTPITSLVLKEGFTSFGLMLGLSVIVIAYELLHDIDWRVGNATFSWYITLISVVTSRLILSAKKISVTRGNDPDYNEEDQAQPTYAQA
ncbi:hypothetical protein GALMADRAFT_1211923 [Galerina marginata CBS 339.88]|uniref:DUF6533 domain-containing protein n=1 Tax=Galerina marginata (strain CBS 339.88) TaxID=685588 RepID=A0A067SGX1_GALM3|nr:hypothetical protein GALMADRAFT_1211923 [Galerina marginata CBS 339.88]